MSFVTIPFAEPPDAPHTSPAGSNNSDNNKNYNNYNNNRQQQQQQQHQEDDESISSSGGDQNLRTGAQDLIIGAHTSDRDKFISIFESKNLKYSAVNASQLESFSDLFHDEEWRQIQYNLVWLIVIVAVRACVCVYKAYLGVINFMSVDATQIYIFVSKDAIMALFNAYLLGVFVARLFVLRRNFCTRKQQQDAFERYHLTALRRSVRVPPPIASFFCLNVAQGEYMFEGEDLHEFFCTQDEYRVARTLRKVTLGMNTEIMIYAVSVLVQTRALDELTHNYYRTLQIALNIVTFALPFALYVIFPFVVCVALDAMRYTLQAVTLAVIVPFAPCLAACASRSKLSKRQGGIFAITESLIGNQCGICFQEYQDDEQIFQFPCHITHRFHFECALTWWKHQKNCPLCRAVYQVDKEEFENKLNTTYCLRVRQITRTMSEKVKALFAYCGLFKGDRLVNGLLIFYELYLIFGEF